MATDYKTPIGKVRLLIADLSEPPLLSDEILQGYLDLYEDSDSSSQLWRAAGESLDAMATSEILLSKKIRTQDLSTDGPAVSAELRKQANELRRRADANDKSFFEFIPLSPYGHLEAEEHRSGGSW